jgi:uncharacterized protein
MFLNIKEMEARRIQFDESFEPGKIDFSDTGVRQAGPVRAVGWARMVADAGGEIQVAGRYSAAFAAECDRCLGPVQYSLENNFDLFYRPPSELVADEVKIDQDEAEIGFYEGSGLELAEVIKEQILLALPMQKVCRDDCKGICPDCGANRNEVDCRHSGKPADDRWTALKNL